ncbi:MAG: tetratricopeptide repeat protein [Saprospiraceae bacterium]|nr:tetratricopeptide repeat protein [Saprospiraceae bacterium]
MIISYHPFTIKACIFLFCLIMMNSKIHAQSYQQYLHLSYEELDDFIHNKDHKAITFKEKIIYAEAGRAKAIKEFGKEDSIYASYTHELGNLHRSVLNYSRALQFNLEAREIQEKIVGKENIDYIDYTYSLVISYECLNNYDKALELYTETLELYEKHIGREHPDYALVLNDLGLLKRKLKNYDDAIHLITQALEIQKKVLEKGDPNLLNTQSNLALLYIDLGEYDKAYSLLLEVIALFKKTEGEEHIYFANTIKTLGLFYEYTGEPREALKLYTQSKNIEEKLLGNEHPDYARILTDIAYINYSLDNHEEAFSYCLKAMNIQEKILGKENPDYANSLHCLGFLYHETGDYQKAITTYKEVMYIDKKVFGKGHANYSRSLSSLALVYEDLGDYEKALPLLVQAKNIDAEILGKEHSNYARTLNNLGSIYQSMGNYKKALSLYIECKKIREKIFGKEHTDYITILNNLAVLYHDMKNYEEALKLYTECKNIDELVVGREHLDYATSANNLAMLYRDLGDYEKALPLVLECTDIERKQLTTENPDLAHSINNLADLYYRMGNYPLAWNTLREAINNMSGLDIAQNIDNEWLTKLSHNNYASNNHIEKVLMSLKIVNQLLQKDSSIINPRQKRLIVAELAKNLSKKARNQTSNDKDKLKWFKKSDEWLQESLVLLSPNKDNQRAFQLAEQNKSILLLQAIQSENNYQLGGLPDSLIQQDKKLQQQRSQLQAKLLEAHPKVEKDSLTNRLNETNQFIDEFDQLLQAKFPKYHRLKNEAVSIEVEKIQSFLDEKTLLLEYVISDSIVHIFSITKTKIDWLQQNVNQQKLKDNIKQLHRILSNYNLLLDKPKLAYQQYTELAYWFHQTLIEPVLQDKSAIQNLVLITDGELGHLPFETFLTKAAPKEETPYNQLEYLLNDYNISYNYSATLWKQNKEAPSVTNNGQVFGIAANYDIKLDKTLTTNRIAFDTLIRKQLGALSNTRKEVKTLENNFNGFFAYDTLASEKTIKTKVGDYAVIHLATHGLLNKRRPMLSSIALTEDSDSIENNFWQAYEISQMELNADLVVLSACETGYGKFEKGNGIASLARAFMYAGSSSLIVSLWKVNDTSTSAIMQNLYQNLATKLPKDQALRQAKLNYIQRAEGIAAHPAFWSPFIQIGNTQPISIQQKNISNGTWWMFAAAGGLACLGIGIFINRRRNV